MKKVEIQGTGATWLEGSLGFQASRACDTACVLGSRGPVRKVQLQLFPVACTAAFLALAVFSFLESFGHRAE